MTYRATATRPPASAGDPRPHGVLIVESSRAMAGMVAASLDAVDGIVCEVADSLAAAAARIATDPARFVVAVVGLSLPDAPHGEIVDVLQRAGLRVIVLTGHVDPSWRRRMFERGVADYVVKDSAAGVDYVVRAVARMYRNLDTQVLVVDDAQVFRDYAASLLAQHGYRTLTARDGQEGLEILAANPRIRVVVTDYLMPRLDGVGMVQEMRKRRTLDDLAIIAISESTEEGVLARFLKSGANDFLRKPFSVEEFYCRIDQNIDMLRAVLDARHLAERDFLTGLFNRRYFFERGARLHAQAARGAVPIVMAMIDIDHFKRVNDVHGHQAGDEYLA
ncbi:MAG: response regulator, partial [Gammaproteobacteria bacterium]|nr:response regulator [Gammaproteobacteria bacterium]